MTTLLASDELALYVFPVDVHAPDNTESKPEQKSFTFTCLADDKEPINFYQPLEPLDSGIAVDKRKGVNKHKNKLEQTIEYENVAFNAKYIDE